MWKIAEYDENGGYDCMYGAIEIFEDVLLPCGKTERNTIATLDGRDYGQETCEPITPEALAEMQKNAKILLRGAE